MNSLLKNSSLNWKIWKTTRPFRYALNQITLWLYSGDNGLDLVDRMLEGIRTEVHNTVQKTVAKTIPREKKCKKAKWLSKEALQIAEERKWKARVQFSCPVMSDSLRPHGLQNARLHCPSPALKAYSNSFPSSQWCHPTTSFSVVLLLPLSIFPGIKIFSNEMVLHIRWPKY